MTQVRIWVRNPLCYSYLSDAAFYHTVGDRSGIVDSCKRGGDWLRVSQLRLLYRVSPASKKQYDRNNVITDISDAIPQSTQPNLEQRWPSG